MGFSPLIQPSAHITDLIQDSIKVVRTFLDREPLKRGTPHFYYGDTWLERVSRSDVAWDSNGNDLMELDVDRVTLHPTTFKGVRAYKDDLFWTNPNTNMQETTGRVPYWSPDLASFLFDSNYDGRTYCAPGNGGLGVTQEITKPATMTFCPLAFEYDLNTEVLGENKPLARMSITKVIPRSATLYHELIHLAVGTNKTQDYTYKFLSDILGQTNADNLKTNGVRCKLRSRSPMVRRRRKKRKKMGNIGMG